MILFFEFRDAQKRKYNLLCNMKWENTLLNDIFIYFFFIPFFHSLCALYSACYFAHSLWVRAKCMKTYYIYTFISVYSAMRAILFDWARLKWFVWVIIACEYLMVRSVQVFSAKHKHKWQRRQHRRRWLRNTPAVFPKATKKWKEK